MDVITNPFRHSSLTMSVKRRHMVTAVSCELPRCQLSKCRDISRDLCGFCEYFFEINKIINVTFSEQQK